jgi:hypothetical protein
LEHLFSTKTVLFVGYGLEELEILEYAILKAKTKQDAQPSARHYLLQGFFSHQWDLYLGLKTYFRNCGIQLIAFRRDERDYDELIDVLERFAREAPASAGTVLQEFAEMKRLLHA